MSLVVETGAIVAGAESYISAADATTYHTARGNTLWTGTDAVKEAALRKATAYLDGKYRSRWKGYKVRPVPLDGLTEQLLEWPRYDVEVSGYLFPCDEIPQRLKDACCELALRALSGPLADDLNASVRRKKIDILETEYAPGTLPGQITYQIIDQLLSDYLKPSGSADVLRG
jgi:hypothetical protein